MDCPGDLDANRIYPITFEETREWMEDFFEERLRVWNL